MAASKCPKCSQPIDEGFIVDHTYGANLHAERVGGPPQRSFWTPIRLGGAERRKVATFCCTGCRYLKSYAQPPEERDDVLSGNLKAGR